MLNFARSTVEHCTQNIQNNCRQWLSDSFRVHQIGFWSGLRPDPAGGAYSALPDPLAGQRGHTSKGGRRGKGEEREGTDPLTQIPGSVPAVGLHFVLMV